MNNPTALGYKAECRGLIGKSDEALTLVDNAIRLYPGNYYYLSIKADVLVGLDDHDGAIECFKKIFEIGSDDDSFFKMHYETCISLKIGRLIESEKYADAWKLHYLMNKSEYGRLQLIDHFKRRIMERVRRHKKRQISSADEARENLITFLEINDLKKRIPHRFIRYF